MAYLRGRYYIWTSGWQENKRDPNPYIVNIWDAGNDEGDHWAEDAEGNLIGSRVAVPESVLDDFVAMRFAELLIDGKLDETIDRAVEIGNFGCMDLQAYADQIKERLKDLRKVPHDEYPMVKRMQETMARLKVEKEEAAPILAEAK